MKIYAESQVVEVPTYTHVGYLATAVYMPNFTIFYIGILVFLIGIIVVAQRLIKNIGKSFIIIFKGHKKQMIVGFTMIVLGVVCVILSFAAFGGNEWLHPEEMTRRQVWSLSDSIRNFRNKQIIKGKDVVVPTDIDDAIKLIGSSWNVEDDWDNPLRIKTKEYKNEIIYFVYSAGEDEKYDTDDDIIYPYEDNTKMLDGYIKYLRYNPDEKKADDK